MRHKIGRFAEKTESVASEPDYEEEASKIKVGDRCEVEGEGSMRKRGTVKFVGTSSTIATTYECIRTARND